MPSRGGLPQSYQVTAEWAFVLRCGLSQRKTDSLMVGGKLFIRVNQRERFIHRLLNVKSFKKIHIVVITASIVKTLFFATAFLAWNERKDDSENSPIDTTVSKTC